MGTGINLSHLYEEDYCLWYSENARLLREKKFNEIDVEHIAEELDSMGRHEEDKLESVLRILFLHLLKWTYQKSHQGTSWKLSIMEHRNRAKKQIKKNPSLKGHLSEICTSSYEDSRYEAAQETGLALEIFPIDMPFTIEQAFAEEWFPN